MTITQQIQKKIELTFRERQRFTCVGHVDNKRSNLITCISLLWVILCYELVIFYCININPISFFIVIENIKKSFF